MTSFQPGDALFVQPVNRLEDVLSFLVITRINPGARIRIAIGNLPTAAIQHLRSLVRSQSDGDVAALSAAWLATHYIDLNATPPLFFFTDLASLAGNALEENSNRFDDADKNRLRLEHERLQELGQTASPEAQDDLNDYVYRSHRRVLEVLIDFPITARLLKPEKWFDFLPGPILARPYSLASPPPKLQLLVAVVNYKTRIATPRLGLASNFLSNLRVGDHFTGWIASNVAGGFDFAPILNRPRESQIPPCLLIAPGTGIAPLRSLVWHYYSGLDLPNQLSTEPNWLLFFGCRYHDKDFYFTDEWSALQSDGVILVHTAFSRERQRSSLLSDSHGRLYVQHRLVECASEVWARVLTHTNAYVYLVGTNKWMPTEVRQALIEVSSTAGGLSNEAAERWISDMETSGRLQMEAWS